MNNRNIEVGGLMNKDNRVVLIPVIFSLLVTITIGGYGLLKGNITSFKSIAIIFGGVCFLSIALSVSLRLFGELIDDFFKSNIKGKIAIVLFFVTFVLRTFYQISLSK